MTLSRIPKWTFWVFGAVALWSGWVFGVRTPIISRLASLDELHSSARNKITAQSERVTAIPAMLQRLDSTQQLLDSMLTGCVETDTLLELVLQVRQIGRDHGLTSVRIDPDLGSVLAIPPLAAMPTRAGIFMDTLDVSMTAQGLYAGIGGFLDDIEARPDFRYWHGCRWQSGDGDRIVNMQARAAFLVLHRHEIASNPAEAEALP